MPSVRALVPLVLGGLIGAGAGTVLHFVSATPTSDNSASLERRDTENTAQQAAAAGQSAARTDDASYSARVAAALRDAGSAAVLAALETIAEPAVARAAALEIAAALGDGFDNIERVALHLSPSARLGFRAEAYAHWAERDASAALAAAAAADADPSAQWTLLHCIALALARTDPESAWLTAKEIVDSEQRNAFRTALLAEWALVAPQAALDFLERAAPGELPIGIEIPDFLVAADPERVLAASDGLDLTARLGARRAAIAALAARDPERALELWSALTPESERDALLASLATGYGAADPSAALAWAAARPDASGLMPALVKGIASVDFTHALGLVADGIAAGRDDAFSWAANAMLDGLRPEDARRLLDVVAANAQPESADQINAALYRWARDDARSALDWLVANTDKVPVDIANSVAEIVARSEAELAMSAVARLPAAHRGDWVRSVVRIAAASDPTGALALLEPYRGESFFAEAVSGIAAARALYDPAGAARVLAQADTEATPTGARVASNWAVRDPAAAEAWVADWPPGEARREALGFIAEQWGLRDLEAAISFALSQPRIDRDAALAGLARGAARRGIADERIFASFDSEEAKLAAADRAVSWLGERYPERARQLIESVAADPARREALETTLARTLMRRFTP